MTAITDDMLNRHAARGVIAADQFRRGDGPVSEAETISNIIADSSRMGEAAAGGVTFSEQARRHARAGNSSLDNLSKHRTSRTLFLTAPS